VSVSQGDTIIRPAVALLVQSAHTFTDVLQHALEFEDTHVFSEARIVDTLLSDVDVTLRNDAGEDLGVAVMTTVGDALLFGRFSSVFFKIASDKVRFALLLCCAVLCCAVLCCAVLCCAVLCCAVLCCAVLCCDVLCCAVLCCAVLCCAVLCCAVLCCAVLCCAVLCCGQQSAASSQQPAPRRRGLENYEFIT